MPRLCFISDTHSQESSVQIPECDILFHAGDLSRNGELRSIENFCEWVKRQPAKHRVVIMGNHDLDRGPRYVEAAAMLRDACTYLEDSGTEIEGLKIYGSPVSPFFYDWRWNRQRGEDIDRHWRMIPDDTHILMTHSPPFGILDGVPRDWGDVEHVGCKDLLRHIDRLKQLKISAHGHIHCARGHIQHNGIHFVNSAICDDRYKPVNPPIIIDL
jgi:Icc-related predicted phosphoesterase